MTNYFDFETEQELFYNQLASNAENDLRLVNQTQCLYYCTDTTQIVMSISSEFHNQRYMCVKTISLEEFRDPLFVEQVKDDLACDLLTSIRNALSNYRAGIRRYTETPPTSFRWTGISRDMRRVESHNVNHHMANRMINDLNVDPMNIELIYSKLLKQTPVEKINWRKEGF